MSEFQWVAVAVVSVMSTARLTRLLTWDLFPPVKAVRDWYARRTDGSDWQLLAFCGYCMGFWMSVLVVLSGWLSDWHTAWWLVNGVLAAGYAGAIVMAFDGDDGDSDDEGVAV